MTKNTETPTVSRQTGLRQPQATIDELRDRIRSGSYAIGDRLPAQRELEEDLHVHRRVVRVAMAQLEKEGLLIRRPNSRPIVRAIPSQTSPDAYNPTVKSNMVGLIIHHYGPHEREGSAEQKILWGMSQALGREGYHAVFLDLPHDECLDEPEIDALHLQYAVDNSFGGVVFYCYSGDKNRDLMRQVSQRIPLVLIDRMPLGVDCDFVGIDNYQSMYNATMYLQQKGHERIAYVTTSFSLNTVQRRLKGYMQAMVDGACGQVEDMVLMTPISGTTWPTFDAVFRLPGGERPTAVMCVNDYEAQRVYERLAVLDLRVPQDVSLVGFDNLVKELPDGTGLTTIAQPFTDIGKESANLFLRRVKDFSCLPLYVEVPADFIVRESVCPGPSAS
jgi:DNA-binding LacI/PurR family transcriptional regulator